MIRKGVSPVIAAFGLILIVILIASGLYLTVFHPSPQPAKTASVQECSLLGFALRPCDSFEVRNYSSNATGYATVIVRGITWAGYFNSPTYITIEPKIEGSSEVILKPDSGALFQQLRIGQQIQFHYIDHTVTMFRAYDTKTGAILAQREIVCCIYFDIEIDSVRMLG